MTAPALRLVVLVADPTLRATIEMLAATRGHEVVADSADEREAVALAARLGADAVVVDSGLVTESAPDLVGEVRRSRPTCAVLVLQRDGALAVTPLPGVSVVDEADHEALSQALGALRPVGGSVGERRVWAAPSAGELGDAPGDFDGAVHRARPGDALVVFRPPNPHAVGDAAQTVRCALRAQDWMLVDDACISVLLVGGNPGAVRPVTTRLHTLFPECAVATAVVDPSEPPHQTLRRVRAATASVG